MKTPQEQAEAMALDISLELTARASGSLQRMVRGEYEL